MKEIKLESELRIKVPDNSLNETKFIYSEIFKDHCYLKHGIAVNDGDTIFDVGANVGLFVLSLARRHADLSIHAFEPTPPVFIGSRRVAYRPEVGLILRAGCSLGTCWKRFEG